MRKYGFSFSPSRAIGLAGLKNSIARRTGVPTTRGGLERKIGRMVLAFTSWTVLGLLALLLFGR